MSRTRPATSGVHRHLLVVAVLAIVVGIFGMHALSSHSTGGGAGHAAMSMPSDHPAGSAPSTAVDVGAAEVAGAGPVAPEHDMGEMTMLCAFMIAAAAGLALLASLLVRRAPAIPWSSARNAARSAPRRLVDVATGAGPPPVWAFSVLRC